MMVHKDIISVCYADMIYFIYIPFPPEEHIIADKLFNAAGDVTVSILKQLRNRLYHDRMHAWF